MEAILLHCSIETGAAMTLNAMNRGDIRPGLEVDIVLKQDQRTGKTTRGIVSQVLTKSSRHPHGIKVRLQDGRVGRVRRIIGTDSSPKEPEFSGSPDGSDPPENFR